LTAACRSHRSNLSEAQNAQEHANGDDDAHPDRPSGAAICKAEGASDDRELPGIP
jgi:hypothetical protein